ncbi:MAG: hypothetical protein VW270_16125, partial [Candidatus Poseidoniales archaeon]|jgi:hypothetical protein
MELMSTIERLMALPTLNDWSRGFLESVKEQLGRRGNLSDKQINIVKKIESENNEDAQKKRKEWIASYDDEKRQIAVICATYYHATGDYYRRMANQVLEDPDFILSEKQWKAMCDNKYAAKVIKATFDDPLYPAGSLVSVRSSAPWRVKDASPQGIFLVVETDAAPVVSACKGAKIYKIMPVGSPNSFIIEERHIKKMKKV